jgi:hypothetical protein
MNLSKHVLAMLIAGALATPALAQTSAPLFSPLPGAVATRLADSTLDAVLNAATTVRVDRVNAAAMLVREDAGELRINLAPGVELTAVRDNAQRLPGDIVTWHGHWRDAASLTSATFAVTGDEAMDKAANEVMLVRNGDMITGSLHVNGKLYAVRPLSSGGHAVFEVDTSRMPADHPAGDMPAFDNTDANASALAGDAPADRSRTRAMIVFSDDAKRALGDPIGLAHLAIAETNQGYANSGVAHRIEMIDTVYASEYRDSGDLGRDLGALTQTGDGQIDWIHQRRNEKGADLVTLIVAGGNACGVGYVNSSAASAFTVATKDCATGYYSYGHELGHNYGATHDPAAGKNTVFPYGHGYYDRGARARTIMSYDCPGGCTRYNVWSSPTNRINGVAAGNAQQSNNARVLNERAAAVAAFR